MTNLPKPPLWVWLAVLLTALASLGSLSFRYRVEQKNKAVGIAVEVAAVKEAGKSALIWLSEAMLQVRQSGATAVVLTEETIQDLVQQGALSLRISGAEANQYALDISTLKRVQAGLKARYGDRNLKPFVEWFWVSESEAKIVFRGDPETILETPVGLNPQDAQIARDTGLQIVARHSFQPGMSEDQIDQTLSASQALGTRWILPMGDVALGAGIQRRAVVREMQRLGLGYLTPEFAKIAGDAALAQELQPNVVRLHAIQSAETVRMTKSEYVDRYGLAFRERNMRFLLVRPLEAVFENPLFDSVRAVKAEIEREGGVVRDPRPFEDPKIPTWVRILIGVGAAVVFFWTAATFLGSLGAPSWMSNIAIGIGLPLCVLAGSDTVKLFSAMLIGVTFPVFAYVALLSRTVVRPGLDFVLTSLTSVTGGLAIAGTLSNLSTMIKTEQVMGVKLIHFLPVLVVAVLILSRQVRLKDWMRTPIRWGTALVALIGLAALFLMLARTGNDSPAAVSSWELKFRSLLDTFMYARPRTKEFLIGHPLMVLGLCWLARLQRKGGGQESAHGWALALLAAGAIGQTSMVNTLCHLHTPIDISLARIGIGWVLGGILGLVGWGAFQALILRTSRGHGGG
ncbi:MAG TPA: DUF5693 family protein [Fimbriimonadaceae bacterium]|nr:DUF5693 family protein [Fimbriimonadaceae bacterium]HRJ32299.1 DUF5693 family protein [Fimbriimonadaceae bacterium]